MAHRDSGKYDEYYVSCGNSVNELIQRAPIPGGVHPVVDLILRRAYEKSKPGKRNDPHKLVLTIEGGAMRGVVTAGMVAGLEIAGLRDVFDVVYGSSGGSSNGAYFLAGQAAYGTTIYYDWINNHKFIHLLRPLSGKAVVDLYYLFDDVVRNHVVLNWDAVINSPIKFKVLASSIEDGNVCILDKFKSQEDLLSSLHASARMPLVAGVSPFRYRDRRYWDSGICDPFGILSSLADKCTHILVLRSRPGGLRRRKLNLLESQVVLRHIAKVSPQLAHHFRMRFEPDHNGVAQLERSMLQPDDPPYLYSITVPLEAPNISRTESRRETLVAGAVAGVNAVLSTLGYQNLSVITTLTAFDGSGHAIGAEHIRRALEPRNCDEVMR